MFSLVPKSSKRRDQEEKSWLSESLKLVNFLPGLFVGFLIGIWVDLRKHSPRNGSFGSQESTKKVSKSNHNIRQTGSRSVSATKDGGELKMVLVVRQDLKMGAGKIASQCAHAAVGSYNELQRSHRSLLTNWELCGQPKIVVTCKNQHELNELKYKAEKLGLPTFLVSDAGRTQVEAGSRTVLAIGPGTKDVVDSVTRQLRLL